VELPFADEVNYWKTSRSSPDAWIGKAVELLKKLGATHIAEGFGARDGKAVFILTFDIAEDAFRISWPVLPSRKPADEAAARIQAATLLYHDTKARALSASILGPRTAFVGSLLLPDGRTVSETSLPAIAKHLQQASQGSLKLIGS